MQIDAGASRLFIYSQGLRILEKLDVEPKRRHGLVQVLNSRVESVFQGITTPLEHKGKIVELSMHVLPSFHAKLTLGIDFLNNFGILVDYKDPV